MAIVGRRVAWWIPTDIADVPAVDRSRCHALPSGSSERRVTLARGEVTHFGDIRRPVARGIRACLAIGARRE